MDKIKLLLQLTESINKNDSKRELLEQFSDILSGLDINKVLFFNRQNEWNSPFQIGENNETTTLNPDKLIHIDSVTRISDSGIEKDWGNYDWVFPVFHKKMVLSYLFIGELSKKDSEEFLHNHSDFVQAAANIISVALENKSLANEMIENTLREKERKLAATMQKMLLPSELPTNELIDVSAVFQAKELVSGDYYDFIPINEDEFVFCIADVSGKGMAAAMLMSHFQATLKANVKYNHQNLTLIELVKELNTSVIQAAKGEKFITFFVGYYHLPSRQLKFINAGHPYPILWNKERAKELKTGCTALGAFPVLPSLETESITVPPNSILVAFTDGITEVENENNMPLSQKEMVSKIAANSELSMAELNKKLLHLVDTHRGSKPVTDDTALLSIRFV